MAQLKNELPPDTRLQIVDKINTGKKDDLIIDLLRKINTDESEGIMPNSMVEAKDPQTYNMMSDYYTLDAIRKFAFNE